MSPIALKVGELYATMRLDDAQFNQGLDGSKSRFEGLRSAIGSGVRAIATGFAAATTTAAGLGVAAFKVGMDFNRLQQNSRAALATILGSAEAAANQMDRLDDFASNSPFARQVWISAQQQLLGFGVEAERVIPILDAVQQSVAAVGGNNEQIEAITYALAQMQGQGKLTGETFNQLGQYGIDAATILGEQLGKTGAEIRELASKPGGIPVDQVWDPLVNGLMERFGGATEGLRQQWDGAMDRIKAAWRDIGAILAEPFIDPMGGGRAVDWANDFADTLRRAQAKIAPFVDLLVERFAPGLDAVSGLFERAQGAINSWDVSKVNRQLDEMSGYTPLIAGLSTAMFALGTSSLPVIGGAINPVVAGFAALAATSPEVRQMLGDFATTLQPLVPLLSDFGLLLADTAMLVLRELSPALGELLMAGGELAVTLGGTLVPALGDLLVNATPLVGVLADVVGWVADLPAPVQAAFLAFLALQGPLSPVVEGLQGVAEGFVRIIQQARVQAVLGETNLAIGGMASGAARASAGISAIGAALKGAFLTSGIGLAIGGVVAALGAFFTAQAEAKRHVDELSDSLDRQTGSLTDNTRELVYNRLEQDGVVEAAVRAGIGLSDLVDAAMDPASDAAGRLRDRVAEANDAISRVHEEEPQNTSALMELRDKYEDLWFVSREVSSEQNNVANAEERARNERAAGLGVTEDATDATLEHLAAQRALREELEEGIDATLSAAEAALRMEDAHARATEAIDRKREADAELEAVMANGNATEEEREAAVRAAEQATRDADRALLDYTRQVDNHISALGRNNASYGEMRAEMARARESFIEQRVQMGMTRAEAEALADQYGLVPHRIDTMVHLSGVQEALALIGNLDRTLNSIDGKQVTASVAVRQYGQAAIASGGYVGDFARALGYAGGGSPKRFPLGGHVTGPGSGTSDEIPAWLSNTEFVQRSAAVKKYGLGFMHAVNSLQFPAEFARPFAVGGSPASPASPVQVIGGAPNLVVYVENPFTGEQVRAVVRAEADGRIREREWQGRGIGGRS